MGRSLGRPAARPLFKKDVQACLSVRHGRIGELGQFGLKIWPLALLYGQASSCSVNQYIHIDYRADYCSNYPDNSRSG
jgi:hypothetical protein